MFPPGEAREDWRILRALSARLARPLPFDDLEALRTAMISEVPHLGDTDTIAPASWRTFGSDAPMTDTPFERSVANFYRTCPISRASATMGLCTDAFVNPKNQAAPCS